MKVLNLYFVVIATFFISSCIESEIIYKVEHNENVIILQRVLTNATSDNYIQVYRNGIKIFQRSGGQVFVGQGMALEPTHEYFHYGFGNGPIEDEAYKFEVNNNRLVW